jgi:hypothetical protein
MIVTTWGNIEKSIVCCTFTSPWNWNEYYDMMDEVELMIGTGNQIVDMILDLLHGQRLPDNAITHFRKIAELKFKDPKRGAIVMVANTTFMQVLIDTMIHVYPKESEIVHPVKNLDSAYAIISERRAQRGLLSYAR